MFIPFYLQDVMQRLVLLKKICKYQPVMMKNLYSPIFFWKCCISWMCQPCRWGKRVRYYPIHTGTAVGSCTYDLLKCCFIFILRILQVFIIVHYNNNTIIVTVFLKIFHWRHFYKFFFFFFVMHNILNRW